MQKNKPGCCIVIYDDDELVAPTVASTLVERGYENVYMLTGGVKKTAKKYPLLVDGEIPEELISAGDSSPRSARTDGQSSSATPRHPPSSRRVKGTNAKLVDVINENEGSARTPSKGYSSARKVESSRPARYL